MMSKRNFKIPPKFVKSQLKSLTANLQCMVDMEGTMFIGWWKRGGTKKYLQNQFVKHFLPVFIQYQFEYWNINLYHIWHARLAI